MLKSIKLNIVLFLVFATALLAFANTPKTDANTILVVMDGALYIKDQTVVSENLMQVYKSQKNNIVTKVTITRTKTKQIAKNSLTVKCKQSNVVPVSKHYLANGDASQQQNMVKCLHLNGGVLPANNYTDIDGSKLCGMVLDSHKNPKLFLKPALVLFEYQINLQRQVYFNCSSIRPPPHEIGLI